jgi:CO dehydrogenase/acetyl-CoA synthase alpha subunit
MYLVQQDLPYIVFVQETYLIENKTAGITRSHRKYKINEEKSRAAIIIAKDNIDAILIKQLCDRDTIVREVRYKSTKIIAASMYLDIKEELNNKIQEM